MVETDRPAPNTKDNAEQPALPLLRPGANRFEAVDRLMAMATEKRADRLPAATSTVEGIVLPPAAPTSPQENRAGPSVAQTATQTAGRVLSMLRPMLPAFASALRLVDHGAVQAAARLLPLLAGAGPQPVAAELPAIKALEAAMQEQRVEMGTLRQEIARADEQLTDARWKGAQLDSEQALLAQRLVDLSGRVRLLTYAVILLLPLVLALIVMLFLHLRT